MPDTKGRILLTALRLFSRDGYEAVSVSRIAGELGITKGALYRHYVSKRDIFNHILEQMERMDAERAELYELPAGTPDEMPDSYSRATAKQLVDFSRAQFKYWTAEEFPACFRRMLTLEQYRSDEMARLYGQYLAAGPLGYVRDLLASWGLADADGLAAELYGPMFLFYTCYDGADDKAPVQAMADAHFDRMEQKLAAVCRGTTGKELL